MYIGLVDRVLPPVQAGVDLVEADGPQVVGHLGEVNGSTDWSTLGRELAPMAQEVWEVAALWLQNPSLGERTAHLGGGLLGRQHLDMEQAGEPLFPVELASKQRGICEWHDICMGRYKSKGISKKALGLGIGAGFLGGAALGVAGGMATASVYQRYCEGWVQVCSYWAPGTMSTRGWCTWAAMGAATTWASETTITTGDDLGHQNHTLLLLFSQEPMHVWLSCQLFLPIRILRV